MIGYGEMPPVGMIHDHVASVLGVDNPLRHTKDSGLGKTKGKALTLPNKPFHAKDWFRSQPITC